MAVEQGAIKRICRRGPRVVNRSNLCGGQRTTVKRDLVNQTVERAIGRATPSANLHVPRVGRREICYAQRIGEQTVLIDGELCAREYTG